MQKKEIALKVQCYLSEELNIDKKFVSVSAEDIPEEDWEKHMDICTAGSRIFPGPVLRIVEVWYQKISVCQVIS